MKDSIGLFLALTLAAVAAAIIISFGQPDAVVQAPPIETVFIENVIGNNAQGIIYVWVERKGDLIRECWYAVDPTQRYLQDGNHRLFCGAWNGFVYPK